jgi:glycosyltransferase involved in cell wall biosynthesis
MQSIEQLPKVLMVATSRKTRGGITAVLRAYENSPFWQQYSCRWIETHCDRNLIYKLYKAISSFFLFVFVLPKYDIVHIHLSEPPSALRKTIFLLWAKFCRKKTILHFHSFSAETTIRGRFSWLYRFLFERADRLIVLSASWKNVIAQEYGLETKIRILPNPCLVAEARDVQKEKKILFAGTLCERKGCTLLLDAFGLIADQCPEWRLVLLGNGDIEGLKVFSQNLGILDKVDFLGGVEGKAKQDAFECASIFCLPSYAEGFPMSVLDAWGYGLPVITTPVGSIPDFAKDGKNCLLIPPGDKTALANQMKTLIESASLRNRLSKSAEELVAIEFRLEKILGKLETIYKEM